MNCYWCRGTGKLVLRGIGIKTCMNCRGTGKGEAGDQNITSRTKPHMIGNTYGKRKEKEYDDATSTLAEQKAMEDKWLDNLDKITKMGTRRASETVGGVK